MSKVSPRFSIITVTHNAENDIEKTFESIKAQSFADYEVILVDGKSEDGTIERVQKLDMPSLTIISEVDHGIYDAMNKGISVASGEYIYFLNAADYFMNNLVIENVNKIINELGSPDLYYGDIVGYVGDETTYLKQPEIESRQFFLRKTICHQAMFVRKELFSICGNFNIKYKIAADFAWLANAYINHNKKFSYHSFPICYYCLSGLSVKKNYFYERYTILKKYFSLQQILFNLYLPWMYKRIKRLARKSLNA